ncbi:MAG: VWA domain-containing protein [Deltaproteobacteria bacterium]|nr:VWA domain-containing protein [Deltaproteobacteria bacterium]
MTSGISEFWRKNISASEAVELANLLRALRKVAGHLGPNIGVIEYAGMSNKAISGIVLDPEMVMGQYPVPFQKVDYLVGLVTHEATHRMEWSDLVWKLLEPVFKKMSGLSLVSFQKMVYTGEDIYVDMVADQKIFGLYVQQTRDKAIKEAKSGFYSGKESVDELIYLWWKDDHEYTSFQTVKPVYQEPLSLLNRLSEDLKSVSRMKKGAAERCKNRADLYFDTWQEIKDLIAHLKINDKKIYWHPFKISSTEDKPDPANKKDKSKPPVSSSLLQEIELKLAKNSVDMTPIIRSIVGSDNEDVVPTSRWDFVISAHPIIDRRLVSRLKAIFQDYACKNKMVSRGLLSGKVDTKRLYRAPVTGRCFLQNDHFPDLDWNVTLLMDASGSMRGNKWRMVENTVANIHKALIGFHNRLYAFAYFEKNGILMISQLIKNNRVQSVPPSGLTASGQAIIAAAYLMPKKKKRNILIHVTDGESNLGCDVQYAIDYCRKEHIDLITLGCGYKDREAMNLQYGKSIQFLDHFGQLAGAMERLLKWTFLYGKKPHLQEDMLFKMTNKSSSESGNSKNAGYH